MRERNEALKSQQGNGDNGFKDLALFPSPPPHTSFNILV